MDSPTRSVGVRFRLREVVFTRLTVCIRIRIRVRISVWIRSGLYRKSCFCLCSLRSGSTLRRLRRLR